jgi:hypothetical protein
VTTSTARITAPPTKRFPRGFVAEAAFTNDICTEAPTEAPYLEDCALVAVKEYCQKRGWTFETVEET